MQFKIIAKSDISKISQEITRILDKDSVLFLSGGSTPKDLYAYWAKNGMETLPGAVAMIDERYGGKWHEKSNEFMIKNTGFISYLEKNNIPFYPMLIGESLDNTAEKYKETFRELSNKYSKKIGIMGVGADTHTAGIPPHVAQFPELASKVVDVNTMVFSYDIPELYDKGFGPRLTLTFSALDEFQEFFILAFGEEKREILTQLHTPGGMLEIPLKFYAREEIEEKVVVLTDQEV